MLDYTLLGISLHGSECYSLWVLNAGATVAGGTRRGSAVAQRTGSTVDELYERHIRPMPLRERLDLAQRILAEAASSTAAGQKHSLLELEGLGAELWEAADAQEYVDHLRREWDPGR
jgi:hypothetical protein